MAVWVVVAGEADAAVAQEGFAKCMMKEVGSKCEIKLNRREAGLACCVLCLNRLCESTNSRLELFHVSWNNVDETTTTTRLRNHHQTMFGSAPTEQVEYDQCDIVVLIRGVSTHKARIFLLLACAWSALFSAQIWIMQDWTTCVIVLLLAWSSSLWSSSRNKRQDWKEMRRWRRRIMKVSCQRWANLRPIE